MGSGRHYWEIHIEKFVDPTDIIIGVAKKGIDIKLGPHDKGKYWGWICSQGKKIYHNRDGRHESKDYGGTCKIGDIIGCLFEIKNDLGYLTFIKNGVSKIFYFSPFLTSLFILYSNHSAHASITSH